jgi:hypothetical protein
MYHSRRKNLSDIYLQSQLRIFIDVIISLSITTCFGPYGPSSGEYNYQWKHLRESHHYGPLGPKHVVILRDITSIKFSVAIAGICLKDSYVYITQQDAPHRDKIRITVSLHIQLTMSSHFTVTASRS